MTATTTSAAPTASHTLTRRDFLRLALALPVAAGMSTLAPLEAQAAGKPGKTALTSWAPASKKIKLGWKKVAGAKGYQVKLFTNKKLGTCVKTVETKGCSCTVKGLRSASFYVARVRAWSKVGGRKVYGPWSAAKVVRTKIKPM